MNSDILGLYSIHRIVHGECRRADIPRSERDVIVAYVVPPGRLVAG
jgi:predicted nucleotidyltransferase